MKILHLTKKYLDILAGDSVVVANLEKQQKSSGHEVTIVTSNCDDIKNGKTIYKFGLKDTPAGLDNITPKRLVSLVFLFFKAFKILRDERPDIIHTHSIDMAFFASFAARYYHIPIVHTFHIVTFNDPKQSTLRRKTELLFLHGAKPKKVFVLNPTDITDFKSAGFNNVVFVPNGVNAEDWKVPKKPKKDGEFTFISVGRLEEQKGYMYLIDAAAKLHETNDNFRVQIIGEGSLRDTLQKQIDKAGLSKHVLLLGNRKPNLLRNYYATADVFVASSLWEAFPITLLEAWAASLPTIATKVGSIPSICSHKNAFLLEPRNPEGLMLTMKKLLESTDRKVLQSTTTYNLQLIADKYNWVSIAKQVEKLYGD